MDSAAFLMIFDARFVPVCVCVVSSETKLIEECGTSKVFSCIDFMTLAESLGQLHVQQTYVVVYNGLGNCVSLSLSKTNARIGPKKWKQALDS